uniref:Uncharacterized protein n=1 Tax=Anguilla anguilla TaxID=7936 RepID=A0A0E9UFR7_ANGAN
MLSEVMRRRGKINWLMASPR